MLTNFFLNLVKNTNDLLLFKDKNKCLFFLYRKFFQQRHHTTGCVSVSCQPLEIRDNTWRRVFIFTATYVFRLFHILPSYAKNNINFFVIPILHSLSSKKKNKPKFFPSSYQFENFFFVISSVKCMWEVIRKKLTTLKHS